MGSNKAYRNVDLSFTDEDLPAKPFVETGGVYDEKVDAAKAEPGVWKSLGGYPSRANAASAANGLRHNRYGHPEVHGLHFTVRRIDPALLPEEARERPFVIFVRHLPNTIVEGEKERFEAERRQRRDKESKARAEKRKAEAKASNGDAKPKQETKTQRQPAASSR